jgi:hypothetical protein
MLNDPRFRFVIGSAVGMASFLLNESMFPFGTLILVAALFWNMQSKPSESED